MFTDVVKVGKLKVGHIGKAILFEHAPQRKGWLILRQPPKREAAGYFLTLASKKASYDTVSLSRLKVQQPYEWSVQFADAQYHVIVRNAGEVLVDKKIRTARKLDYGFAATVRRRGNLADFVVFTDHNISAP